MSLKEEALQARKERQQMGYSIGGRSEREKSLDELIENWPTRWHLKLEEMPAHPQAGEVPLGETRATGTAGVATRTSTGWAFAIDDLEFIYDKEHGMCVDPDVPGLRRATHGVFVRHGRPGKKLLKDGRLSPQVPSGRRARARVRDQVRPRDATKLSASAILEEALEVMNSWPSR